MDADRRHDQEQGYHFDPFMQPPTRPAAGPPYATRQPSRPHRGLLIGLILGGATLFLGATAATGWWAYDSWQDNKRAAASDDDDDGGSTSEPTPRSQPARHDDPNEPLGEPAPEQTKVTEVGALSVVDVGRKAVALERELRTQEKLAAEDGKELLIMLSGRGCTPCRGVDAALSDRRMQKALESVRLVRVDMNVFGEELNQLEMPTGVYPAFFLLGSDMRPKDGIHGGEWDEDIAENIAPVLHAFTRGEYTDRRHGTHRQSSGGVAL